jgi:Ni/Co efflux regulator RcnB
LFVEAVQAGSGRDVGEGEALMRKLVLGAAAAAMTLVSGAASAQAYGSYDRYGRDGWYGGYSPYSSYGYGYNQPYTGYDHRYGGYDPRYGAYGYGRGDVYPYYRQGGYAIPDYWRYGLPAPPRGYGYFRSGRILSGALRNRSVDPYGYDRRYRGW